MYWDGERSAAELAERDTDAGTRLAYGCSERAAGEEQDYSDWLQRACEKVREKFTGYDCLDAISEMPVAWVSEILRHYRDAEHLAWRNDAQTALADAALGKFIRERIEDYVTLLAEMEL